MTAKRQKNISIVIDGEVHRQAKSLAALQDKTLLAWIQGALASQVEQAQTAQHQELEPVAVGA